MSRIGVCLFALCAVFFHGVLCAADFTPVIGVTGYANDKDTESGPLLKFKTSMAYWRALRDQGAIVLRMLPVDEELVPSMLDRVDGVLLCGGPDVPPQRYGEKPHETVNALTNLRADFDFAVAREVLKRDMPVLGICLGSQIINVVRGGTLVQDIPSQVGETVAHRPVTGPHELLGPMHPVRLTRGSRLASYHSDRVISVNSYHHQAVKKLGKGLAIAARSVDDNVVEGFEDPSAFFLLGVQFHPEVQVNPQGIHNRLFEDFVNHCREYAQKRR